MSESIKSASNWGICHVSLTPQSMDPTVLHTLEATAVFSCPDLIMMQNFSMMDLLWREGRDTRAE